MGNDVRISVTLDDGGSIANKNKDAKDLKQTLMQAGEVAQKIRVPQAVRAAAAPSGTGETKTARSIGAGAGTGSAASDFAAQASGLGGLVHVYATFAANIFAVSAAFNALSKSMDISNLTKGLDQLGAASGKSLGGIAKQMVMISDGALSLQQSLRSTALASSGGISNENMLRLTEVAKKASIALGRDLPDSMDRLTKGIVKVQPELLDELGIMTRVIPAQEAYARSIGKSISSLTTFEKQQAFTNAVLAEGEKKFKDIDLVSNPYSKLAASVDNLLQGGLEQVNKVLGTIANILASNPTALATALAAVGLALLNQALPAIGAFRQNLQKLADESRDMAVARAAEARKGHEEAYKTAKSAALDQAKMELNTAKQNAEAIAEQKVASVEAVEKKISGYKNIVRKGSAAEKILSKDLPDVTDQDIARLELNAKQQASNKKAAELQMEYAKTLREYKASELDYAAKEVAATQAKTAAEQKYNQEAQIAAKQQIDNLSFLSTLKQNQIIADRALLNSVSQSITAQAANTGATKGLGAAWKEVKESVVKAMAGKATIDTYVESIDAAGKKTKELATVTAPAMGTLQGGWTLVKAGITGATGAITTFLSFAGPWIQAIGIAVAIFQGLYNWVSKSREANEKFNGSLDLMTSAVKTAGDTMDRLKAIGFNESMNVDAIQARANAFAALSDSIKPALDNFAKLEQLKNPLEKLIDGIFGMVGKSDSDNLYKGIAKSITKSFELISDPKLQKQYQAAVNQIFGKDIDVTKLQDALAAVSPEKRIPLMEKLAIAEKTYSKELSVSASAGIDFKNSLVTLGQEVSDYTNKLLPTDDYAKFGIALAKIYNNLTSTVLNSLDSVAAVQQEIKNNPILGIFAPEAVKDITKARLELELLYKAKTDLAKNPLAATTKSDSQQTPVGADPEKFKAAQKEFAKFNRSQNTPTSVGYYSTTSNLPVTDQQQMTRIVNNQIANTQKVALDDLLKRIKSASNEFLNVSANIAKIQGSMAIQQAQISVRSSYGDSTATAERSLIMQEASLKRSEVAMQYKMYDAQKANTEAIINLTETFDLSTASVGADGKRTGATASGKTAESIYEAQANRAALKEKNPEDDAVKRAQAIAYGKIKDETTAKLIANTDKASKEAFANSQTQLDIDAKGLTLVKQKTDLQAQYTQGFSQSLANASLQTDLDFTSNKYQKERNDLQNKYANSIDPIYKKQLNAQIALVDKSETQEKLALRVNAAYASSQKTLSEEVRLLDRSNELTKAKNDLADVKSKAEKDSLDYYRQVGAVTESELLKANAQLDIQKSIRDEQAAQAQIARDKKQQLGELSNRENAAKLAAGDGINAGTLSTDQQKAFDDERAAIQQLANIRSTTASATSAAEQSSIDRNTTLKALYADQSDSMLKMQNVTENLATVFGTLGDSIGKAGESLLKMSQDDTNYLNAKQKLLDKIDDARSPDEEAAALKKLNTLENNYAITKDKNSRTALTNVKNLFSQETNTYKIITGLEKAKAALTLGNQVQMLQTTIQNTKKLITETIPGIYATALAYLGPVAGPIAATAAIAAFVGGEFGGGGGSAPDFKYDTYKKEQGNYIDSSTPQNTGIKDSLDALVSISKPELPLTSKMARHLENIDGKIQTFVNYQLNDIGNAVSGVTPSFSRTGASSLVSMGVGSVLGAGMGAAVTGLATLTASAAGSAFVLGTFGTAVSDAASSAAMALFELGDLFAPGVGTVVGAILGSSPVVKHFTEVLLTGSDTITTGLQGMGFEIEKQTLAMAGSNLAIQDYADILTTKYHQASVVENFGSALGFGGGDSTTPSVENRKGITDPKVKAAFEDMFSSITNSITIGANALKIPLHDLIVPFKKLEIVADDAKGNLERVNTYFGEVTDDFVKQYIPDIQKYTQGTEKASQTFYRLAAGQEEAKYYTDKLNISTVQYSQVANKHGDITAEILRESITGAETAGSGIANIIDTYSGTAKDMFALYTSLKDVQQGMVTFGFSADTVNADLLRGAGGIDALNASWSSFENNFLTGTERQLAQQAKMDTEFGKLGLQTPKTAEGFRDLVVGLEAGGAASSEQLGRVLSLTDGIKALVGSVSEISSQEIKIYELLGKSSEALTLSRQKELDVMAEALRPRQIYINALTDETTLRNKLKAAYVSSNTALANSIKTLTDYKTALTAGADSVLSPAEKYAQAKSIFMQTAAAATAVITASSSTTDVANRDAALAKLTSTADVFKSASRDVNASGAQYIADFKSITDTIDKTTSILSTQQTDQQKQLGFLDDITTATETTADLLARYLAAQGITSAAQADAVTAGSQASLLNIGQHANGGIARGLSIVGERGPELVDFATPSRVYSNQASNDLFNNKELIAEIKALREEVCQLRDDQNKQTGAIIDTTIQSNAQNAQMIAAANQNMANQQDWKTRSQVRVA